MMIKATSDSPYVHLSRNDNVFEIIGNSYYVTVSDLYIKVIKWIEEEIPYLETNLNCMFHFRIISSASLKKIIDILYLLDDYFKKEGKQLKVTWICDHNDSDNIEIAHDFLDFTEMPLEIIERY